MADNFDANGLTINTLAENITQITDDMKTIYGSDISVASDDPDGQQINIIAQQGIDQRELLLAINAARDIDQAEGINLDIIVAYIGLKRNGATFTYQNIEITIDRAMGLVGLDSDPLNLNPTGIYTVKDDTGNMFYLLDSVSFTGAGTYSLNFRAAAIGQVQTSVNTITTPVTVLAGVVSINNPAQANSIGIDEESDFQLRNRFKASIAISSTGSVESLQATLANLPDVTVAKVYENYTHVTDINGIPANTIWAIVQGGDPDAIGQAIYAKRGMGCGMKGNNTVNITKPDGTNFVAKYDEPVDEDIFIRFKITGIYDVDYVKTSILSNLFWPIGENASGDMVTTYLKDLSKTNNYGWIITQVSLSIDGFTWAEIVPISGLTGRFINNINNIILL
jgi:uncharacterized phage protein gp47/JayE